MLENGRLAILENLRKYSESGRKSLENRQNRRYFYVYLYNNPSYSRILIGSRL